VTTRTILGNLATEPAIVQAGTTTITKLRILENTGEYRAGTWTEHENPTSHFVEAKFELGEHAAESLNRGDPVIVVGREYTVSRGEGDQKKYGRVIDADAIGVDLRHTVVHLRRMPPKRAAAEARPTTE
jgi:single-strand DNA-binding protein